MRFRSYRTWLTALVAASLGLGGAAAAEDQPASTAPVPLTEVTVTENKEQPPKEGSAQAGYRAETVKKVGPWTDEKVQDLPYSLNVMPSDLIQNIQATTIDQLFRINPLVQVNYGPTRNGIGQIISRGFNFIPSLEDGVRINDASGVFLEEVERVELLSGLTGFLYGPADVGGTVNYVLKRPTAERYVSLTAGNSDGGTGTYWHADVGGPVDAAGKVGYRFNAVYQNGGTAVDRQSLKRELFSGAVDWHILDNLLLQLDAAHSSFEVHGVQPAIFQGPAVTGHPPPAPAADQLFGPTWSYAAETTDKVGGSLSWHINDVFTARAAYKYRINGGSSLGPQDRIAPDGTISNKETDLTLPYQYNVWGYYAFLDAKFRTAFLDHALTAGVNVDTVTESYTGASYPSPGTNYPQPADPSNYPVPTFTTPPNSRFVDAVTTNYNLVIGDEIKAFDMFSLLVGVNAVNLQARGYDVSGTKTDSYSEWIATPSVALVFKPIPWTSIYGNFMQAVEQGRVAPTTYNGVAVVNAGEIMKPIVDTQFEVGVKQTLWGMLLTAALFDITKENQYVVPETHVFTNAGRQENKGFEFTASGKATRDLTVVGGFTVLSAKATQTQTPATHDFRPGDTADQLAKLYLEYDLPFVPGATATGGINYVGDFVNSANTIKYPEQATVDLGARYALKLMDTKVTARVNVTNLLDKSYWMANYYVGYPRTINGSVTVQF